MIRLNLGCGPVLAEGWTNIDRDRVFRPLAAGSPTFLWCDLLDGLPFEDGEVDYAVMHHSANGIVHADLPRAFAEVHRVLRPGGVLRLSVPDILAAHRAVVADDRAWFPNAAKPEHELDTIETLYATWLTWYGQNVTAFTADYLAERLRAGGFWVMNVVPYRGSITTEHGPGLVELDAREHESLFMEALR